MLIAKLAIEESAPIGSLLADTKILDVDNKTLALLLTNVNCASASHDKLQLDGKGKDARVRAEKPERTPLPDGWEGIAIGAE